MYAAHTVTRSVKFQRKVHAVPNRGGGEERINEFHFVRRIRRRKRSMKTVSLIMVVQTILTVQITLQLRFRSECMLIGTFLLNGTAVDIRNTFIVDSFDETRRDLSSVNPTCPAATVITPCFPPGRTAGVANFHRFVIDL